MAIFRKAIFLENFFKISYYTSFTVFVLSGVLAIFSLVVIFIAFLYWSATKIFFYLLNVI